MAEELAIDTDKKSGLTGLLKILFEVSKIRITVLVAFTTTLGYILAAQNLASFSLYPIAGIFFTRACELSGESDIRNIDIAASMLSVQDNEEAIEQAYSKIPIDKQPASRRLDYPHEKAVLSKKKTTFDLLPLAKINIEKGSGASFDYKYVKTGTIEVWNTESDKVRVVYTSSPIPSALFEEIREFRFEGKREKSGDPMKTILMDI